MNVFKQKLLTRINEDQRFNELKLTPTEIEDNLLSFNRLYDIEDNCNLRTNDEFKKVCNFHIKLIRNGENEITVESFKCPKQSTNADYLLKNNYIYSSIDTTKHKQLLNKNDLLVDENGAQPDRVELIRFLLKIKKNKIQDGSFYMYGDGNFGKTYAIFALCNELALQNKRITYLVANDFYLEIMKMIRQQTDNTAIIDNLKQIDVLVIEDLGIEKFQNYLHMQVLYSVLSYRLASDKLCIFSSSYSIKELTNIYKVQNSDVPSKTVDTFIRLINKICKQHFFRLISEIK